MTLHQILKRREEESAKAWERIFTKNKPDFIVAVGVMFSILVGFLFYKLACIFVEPTDEVLIGSIAFALLFFVVILTDRYEKFRKNQREKIERNYQ
ncbi:hypothetical protein MIZ01_1588 [Sideroxyarcus emersonii]|uniref:Uncharacterized protein n=1 Tax=Sideroxyarcus emersonii TaxID=2764705 RepID=A0AAN1XA77_9PROT|nr:hypothetical protein [Sideroxyarcus emersonii]BCK87792.1 hypothetical protein MIZ01_1588 [Sideroxyarcus emersonii]